MCLHVIDPSNSSIWPKDAGISQILSKFSPFSWRKYWHESPRYPECFLDNPYPGVFSWHPGNARFQGTFWFTTQRFHDIRLGHPVVGSCWVNSRWFNRPLLKVACFCNNDFCFISPWVDKGGWQSTEKSGRNRNPF